MDGSYFACVHHFAKLLVFSGALPQWRWLIAYSTPTSDQVCLDQIQKRTWGLHCIKICWFDLYWQMTKEKTKTFFSPLDSAAPMTRNIRGRYILVLCIVQLGSGRCLPALLLSVRQCNINSLHFPLHSLCCFCVFFCLVIFLPEGWLPVEKVWVCPLVHPNVLQVNPYGILSMFVYKPPCTRVRHALERLSGKCTNLLECPPPIPVFVSI